MRTPDVRIQLQQKSAGSGKLIVEFADTDSRDTIFAAIKTAISPQECSAKKYGFDLSRAEYTRLTDRRRTDTVSAATP
jgi:hypothetical protein